MARTKEAVRRQWRAVAATAAERRAAIAKKAARIRSVEEVEAADTSRRIEKQGGLPPAEQVVKLSGRAVGDGGFIVWRGRLRGGAERALEGSWVRCNFKASFLNSVVAERGRFVYIPTGRAQERPPPIAVGDHHVWDGPKVLAATATPVMSVAACPVIAYQQGGADLCAAYSLASAIHSFGDASAAAAIAGCAHAALVSGDAFVHVRTVVRSQAAGWSEVPLAQHDPLATLIAEPVHLQLVGSDGAGTHAVATLGGLIFDSAEARALLLCGRASQRRHLFACGASLAPRAGKERAHVAVA